MDKKLFEAVTSKEWLTKEEMDSMRREFLGEGIDELDEAWEDMVRFEYQMEQFDVVKNVSELGATTTIVVLWFSYEDINAPYKKDSELISEMIKQDDEVGEIARLIELDDSLYCEEAGSDYSDDDIVRVYVMT